MKKFRKIAALLAVTALVLTGCSGGKKETEKATEKATTAQTQAVEETVTEAAQAVQTEAAVVETEAATVETEVAAAVETAVTEAEESLGTAMTEAEEAVAEVMTEAEEAAAEAMTEAEAAEELLTEAEEVLGTVMTEAEEAVEELMTEAEETFEAGMTEAEVAETEAAVVETEAEVAETEAAVVETEAEVAETEAPVVETEAEVVETEAEAAETEAEEVDFSAVETVSDGKLIVGTEAGFAPYEYLVGNEVKGIDMDIAQAIADALGVELEVQNMDFDGALLAVQQGKVDIVAAGVSVSDEREEVMDFSVKYVDSKDVVLVNKADPKVEESTAEALEGKVVGVQQGNIADLWVSENAAPKSVQRYTKFVQAAQDLLNGKIDCIVMDEAPALELVASNDGLAILEGEALFEDSYAVAIKKGNEQMKAAVDAVITQLQESGQMDEIIASHSTASEGAAQTEAEAAQTEAE